MEIGQTVFRISYRFNKAHEPNKVKTMYGDVFDVINMVQSQGDELYVYYIEPTNLYGTTLTMAVFPNDNKYKTDSDFIIDLLTNVKTKYSNNH